MATLNNRNGPRDSVTR